MRRNLLHCLSLSSLLLLLLFFLAYFRPSLSFCTSFFSARVRSLSLSLFLFFSLSECFLLFSSFQFSLERISRERESRFLMRLREACRGDYAMNHAMMVFTCVHKQDRKCTGRKLKVSSNGRKFHIISQTVFSQLNSNHRVPKFIRMVWHQLRWKIPPCLRAYPRTQTRVRRRYPRAS